jgi:hypothetical protein
MPENGFHLLGVCPRRLGFLVWCWVQLAKSHRKPLVDGGRTREVLNWSYQDSYECLPLDDKHFLCGRFGISPKPGL